MYRKPDHNQMSVYDFVLPFGGHLNPDNRWVKLHDEIDWTIIEEEYEKNFQNKDIGNVSYPAEMAFGALYIQRTIGCTDRELVQQISENPYMQYFIGLKEFSTSKPFDPSLLVYFRKRLTDDVMSKINERIFIRKKDEDDNNDKDGKSDGGSGSDNEGQDPESPENNGMKELKKVTNKGTAIIDATCTPADIAF